MNSIYRNFWKEKNAVNFERCHLQQRKKCIETAVTKPFTLLKRLLFCSSDPYKLHVYELQYIAFVNVAKASEYINTPPEHLNISLF